MIPFEVKNGAGKIFGFFDINDQYSVVNNSKPA